MASALASAWHMQSYLLIRVVASPSCLSHAFRWYCSGLTHGSSEWSTTELPLVHHSFLVLLRIGRTHLKATYSIIQNHGLFPIYNFESNVAAVGTHDCVLTSSEYLARLLGIFGYFG